MNITNRIKRDIDIYNGVTPAKDISPSYNIFTLSNLRIILTICLIIFIIFYLYNSNLSIDDYKTIINNIINYIKKLWNDFILFINDKILNKNTTKSTSQIQQETKQQEPQYKDNLQDIPQDKNALNTIKTALDINSLKYIATTEDTNENKDDIPGWCYIGKNMSGVNVCAQANNASLCESNLFYENQEQCVK